MKKIKLVTLSLTAFLAVNLNALTLNEAVDIALKNNFDIQSKNYDYIESGENVKLNKIEKHFQELYFDLYKDKFLCFEMVAYGERNPNFGNYWSQEKKDKMSKKRKNNEHSKGKNNPRATPCILHFPNGNKEQFNFLGEMRSWFWENITDGIQIRLQENEFEHLKFIKNNRKEAYAKSIGYYYTRV